MTGPMEVSWFSALCDDDYVSAHEQDQTSPCHPLR